MGKIRYHQLSQQDGLLDDLGEAGQYQRERRNRRKHSGRAHLWHWIGQALLFFISVTLFITGRGDRILQRPVEQLSAYSPALTAVSDAYEWQRFDGTVLGDSPYRGPLDNETLARWHRLTSQPVFRLSQEELLKVHPTDPDSAVQFPDGGYMAWLEVYHQMHCLEVLWKHTYPEFYNIDHGEDAALHRKHLDHCADMLRQKLLCDSDVSVVTFSWVKHMNEPTPNFNVLHKCRDFEAIRAWSEEHQVVAPGGGLPKKPADAIELDELP